MPKLLVSLLIQLDPYLDRKVVIYITAKYLYVNELTYKYITKIRLQSDFFPKKYACSDIFLRKYDQNMHMELGGNPSTRPRINPTQSDIRLSAPRFSEEIDTLIEFWRVGRKQPHYILASLNNLHTRGRYVFKRFVGTENKRRDNFLVKVVDKTLT